MELHDEPFRVLDCLTQLPKLKCNKINRLNPTRALLSAQTYLYQIYEGKFNDATHILAPSVKDAAGDWNSVLERTRASALRLPFVTAINKFFFDESTSISLFLIYCQEENRDTCGLTYTEDVLVAIKAWYDSIRPFLERWNPVADIHDFSSFSHFLHTFAEFEKREGFLALAFSDKIRQWFCDYCVRIIGVSLFPTEAPAPVRPMRAPGGFIIDFLNIKETRKRFDNDRSIHRKGAER